MSVISDFFDGCHGVIFPVAGFKAPAGFLLCDGMAVSRTQYAALFSAITLQLVGTTAAGSPTISGIANTTGVQNGMPISGPGVPAGTTVQAFTANAITLSKNATAAAAGITVVVAPYGVGDGSLTFNIPDLRGEFLRGHDQGRNVDTSRVLGSAQADGVKDHTHVIKRNTGTGAGSVLASGFVFSANSAPINSTTQDNPVDMTTLVGGGSPENRPRNVAVLYCIKT